MVQQARAARGVMPVLLVIPATKVPQGTPVIPETTGPLVLGVRAALVAMLAIPVMRVLLAIPVIMALAARVAPVGLRVTAVVGVTVV